MSRRSSSSRAGRSAAAAAAILYGTSWVAAGIALVAFSPLSLGLWRALVTMVVLVPFLFIGRGLSTSDSVDTSSSASRDSKRRGRALRLVILGLLGGAAFGIGMNVSVVLTGATITAFIAGLYPVIAAAAAPLILDERVRPVALLGLLMGAIGTLLIAGFDAGGLNVGGLLVALATAMGTGMFLLLARRWQLEWDLKPIGITITNMAMLAIVSAAAAVLLGTPLLPSDPSTAALLATLWLGIAAGAIATFLLAESLRRLPAAESSAYLMLNPLTASILAVLILGESLGAVQLLGAILILVGIGLATGLVAIISDLARRHLALTSS
jgi:drug/metabolite transporter (DMT)-like permease